MVENLDILNTAISLFVRAMLLAARFSGRVRKRSLKRLAAMDTDAKTKEIPYGSLVHPPTGRASLQVLPPTAGPGSPCWLLYSKQQAGSTTI